jgi:hypothetical protein
MNAYFEAKGCTLRSAKHLHSIALQAAHYEANGWASFRLYNMNVLLALLTDALERSRYEELRTDIDEQMKKTCPIQENVFISCC